MDEIVTSPGGDRIEVVNDNDWATLHGWGSPRPLYGQNSITPMAVVRALWEHGPYVNASGKATRELYADAQRNGYRGAQTGLTTLMQRGTIRGGVHRTTKGKTTSRIVLTAIPRTFYEQLAATNGSGTMAAPEDAVEPDLPEDHAAVILEPAPDLPDTVDLHATTEPAIQLEVANAVATALLAQVIDIVSTGRPDTSRIDTLETSLGEASGRLSVALEEADRLRRQIRQTGEELAAVRTERDGLRQRLRLAETNLQAALNPANQRTLGDIVHREMDRLMRSTPIHRSPDDNNQPGGTTG